MRFVKNTLFIGLCICAVIAIWDFSSWRPAATLFFVWLAMIQWIEGIEILKRKGDKVIDYDALIRQTIQNRGNAGHGRADARGKEIANFIKEVEQSTGKSVSRLVFTNEGNTSLSLEAPKEFYTNLTN